MDDSTSIRVEMLIAEVRASRGRPEFHGNLMHAMGFVGGLEFARFLTEVEADAILARLRALQEAV